MTRYLMDRGYDKLKKQVMMVNRRIGILGVPGVGTLKKHINSPLTRSNLMKEN